MTAREKFIKLLLEITNHNDDALQIVFAIIKKLFGFEYSMNKDDEFNFDSLQDHQEFKATYHTINDEGRPYMITLSILFSDEIKFVCYINNKHFDDYLTDIPNISLQDIKEITDYLKEFVKK